MKNIGQLRVMYFDHTAMLGGGEIALLNLIASIDRELVRPIVVLSTEGPLAEALRPLAEVHILELPEDLRRAKKDRLRIATLLKFRQVFQIARYINRLRQFIRKKEIDIVHTNSLKADIIGGLAGRLAFVPVIWHLRDRIESDYLPGPVVKVFRFLARAIPTFIVTVSEAVLNTLKFESDRTAVIHDGTTLPPLFESPAGKKHLQVGLIGRICPWKGQDVFLQAVAIVKSQFPQARFQIVGSALFDEQEYERGLRTLSSQLRVDDVVTFTGFRSDMATVLEDLDIVVHASTLAEPFGQVIIEGMAAAKPVIATNGGGVAEILVHGETGLMVPMKDTGAMADAICELLADRTRRLEMGHKGRERVRAKFTLQRTALGVQAIYAKIQEYRRGSSTSEMNPFRPFIRGKYEVSQ